MNRNQIILELARFIQSHFSESDWIEFGYLTDSKVAIDNHPRLLKALRFGDDDYGACVFAILEKLSDDELAKVKKSYLVPNETNLEPRVTDTTQPDSTPPAPTNAQASTPAPRAGNPMVFIGSSAEGLGVAENLQLHLERVTQSKIWSQGIFEPSMGSLEDLCNKAKLFDFAIFVFTPDDLSTKRGETKLAPRDNVLFELGLFMGTLGRDRVYYLYCRGQDIDLPTDLAGITPLTYEEHEDGDLEAALGPVATRVKKKFLELGRRNLS